MTRIASSGSTASPGTGWREISLGGSYSVNPLTDYLAIVADNTTSSFGHTGSPYSPTSTPMDGLSYIQDTSFPLPATTGTL